MAERLARLIKQLGHDKFAKREQASKELDAIGEPALGALRKATSDEDAEIRHRATKIVAIITSRIRAAVTSKELEKLQGSWSLVSMEVGGQQIKGEDKSFVFAFEGDKWSLHVNGQLSQAGTVQQIEVRAKHNAIDLPITEGGNVGTTATSIYAVDGNLMRYLNCGEPRATDFTTKPDDGRCYSIFRRVKPEAARPPGRPKSDLIWPPST
jgi:uncharacterized protein (TIGR03067 family)